MVCQCFLQKHFRHEHLQWKYYPVSLSYTIKMFQKAHDSSQSVCIKINIIYLPVLVYTVRQLVWWKSMWPSLKWCLTVSLVMYLSRKHAINVQTRRAIVTMLTGMRISSKTPTENEEEICI